MPQFTTETTEILQAFSELDSGIFFDPVNNFDLFLDDSNEKGLLVSNGVVLNTIGSDNLQWNNAVSPVPSADYLNFFNRLEVNNFIDISGVGDSNLDGRWEVTSLTPGGNYVIGLTYTGTVNDNQNITNTELTIQRVIEYPSNYLLSNSSNGSISAQANIPIQFASLAPLGDINGLLAKFTLFELPFVTFSNPQSKFDITEIQSGSSAKIASFPYGNAADIPAQPDVSQLDISSDEDVTVTLTNNDIDRINNAVSQYQIAESQQGLDSAVSGVTAEFDFSGSFELTPVENESGLDLSSLQFKSEQYTQAVNDYTQAVDDYNATNPNSVTELPSLQIGIRGLTGGNTVTFNLAKDSAVLSDQWTMTLPAPGTPFVNDFTFYVDASFFSKILSGIDYELILSSLFERMQLTGELTYVNITYNQSEFDSNISSFNSQVEQFETDIEAYEEQKTLDIQENDEKLEDAKFALRDAKLVAMANDLSGSGGTGTYTYVAPTPAEELAEALNNGYSETYEADYDTTGPGAPGNANPRPNDPADLVETDGEDTSYISNVTYWTTVDYVDDSNP